MKKVLMIALMLVFFAGTASAATYVGLFSSEITAPPTAADCAVYPGAYQPYDVYVMVNADANGCSGVQFRLDDEGAADFQAADPETPMGGVWLGSAISDPGIAGAPFPNFTGWGCVYILHLVWKGVPHHLNVLNYTGLDSVLILDKDGAEAPAMVNTPQFGVGLAGTPTNDSSWGAVKSLYK